jgi:hypothetical protein
MKKRQKKWATVILTTGLLCISAAVPVSAQTCQTISYGNHWHENEFQPYTGEDWGANYILKDTTKAKVLLFFSHNCSPSVNAIQSMTNSDYLNHENVEIEFIDTIKSSKNDIKNMIAGYGLSQVSDKIFFSPTSYPNQTSMWEYVDYSELNLSTTSNVVPVTIILDGNNQIRYAANNRFSLTEVDCVIETLLNEGESETVPAETVPDETAPAETAPEETAPAETVPEETAPAETVPEETAPAETVPEETAPAETAPEETAPAEAESNTVTLYFMTGSSPDDPDDVFAEFEVPKNARKGVVSLKNTLNTLPKADRAPHLEGKKFSHWQEQNLYNPSKLGNRISGVIWTNETDQYIYAQYK